jgi:transcriptional regulatory protein LevR
MHPRVAYEKMREAVTQIDEGSGVLIMVDMGSTLGCISKGISTAIIFVTSNNSRTTWAIEVAVLFPWAATTWGQRSINHGRYGIISYI